MTDLFAILPAFRSRSGARARGLRPVGHAALALGLGLAASAVSAVPAAAPQQTYDLRSWFEHLPAGPTLPTQVDGDTWTFRAGSADGGLLGPRNRSYYIAPPALYQQIGSLVDVGTGSCSAGYCPANASTTRATFDGVFVHPGSGRATVAVFTADHALTVDEIDLSSESVGNSLYGNGFSVNVLSVIGGVTSSIGSFTFNLSSTATVADERQYLPGIALQPGDQIAIAYGDNGGYLYDHGNVNATIFTTAVPEPSTWAMWLAGAAAVGRLTRRRRLG